MTVVQATKAIVKQGSSYVFEKSKKEIVAIVKDWGIVSHRISPARKALECNALTERRTLSPAAAQRRRRTSIGVLYTLTRQGEVLLQLLKEVNREVAVEEGPNMMRDQGQV